MQRQEKHPDEILDQFLEQLGDPSPSPEQMELTGARVWNRLQSEMQSEMDDAQELPLPESYPVRSTWKWQWVLAVSVAFAVAALLLRSPVVRNVLWKSGSYAILETADGSVSRTSGGQTYLLHTGDRIGAGEIVRAKGTTGAQLVLTDGSRVEMRSQSEVALESAADGVRIRLNNGSVIVSAAKQGAGHLYVQTRDCTVSVVGTVFLVSSAEAGSRVAVIQGEVHVQQGATARNLRPGEQVATAASLAALSLSEEIAWSSHAAEHLALLKLATAVHEAKISEPERSADLVEGRVLDTATGDPVAAALVSVPGDNLTAPVRTQSDGRFLLRFPYGSSGNRDLAVEKDGYVNGKFLIRVEQGPPVHDVVVHLMESAVVEGRVLDEAGEPMRGVRVRIFQDGYADGQRKLIAGKPIIMTNDEGRFRAFWLDPGSYFIAMDAARNPSPILIAPSPPHIPRNPAETYITTFFPGTADAGQASPVVLHSGENFLSDMRVIALRLPVVRGTVVYPGQWPAGQSAYVTVWPAAPILYAPAYSITTGVGSEPSRFEIRGLSPGKYWLNASIGMGGSGTFTARKEFEVGEADLDGLEVAMIPNVTIHGQVVVSKRDQAPQNFAGVQIHLKDLSGYSRDWMSDVRPDGSFVVPNIPAAGYTVRVTGLARDSYVAAATFGDADALSKGFDTGAGDTGLTVGIDSDGARVRGTVTDSQKTPQAGAAVVLIPQESLRSRIDLFHSVNASSTGEFEIRGVAPGSYTLLAFERIAPGAYLSSEFMDNYKDRGVSVEISADGSNLTMNLEWISRR